MSENKLYTENEVKSLITKAFDDAFYYGHYDEQYVFVDGVKIDNDASYWIEQNLNQNKDEKDPKNKDGKDPNAIYDWGSFPLEKNFEWKNQNKDE